jgi:signal transduction histidine kinase
VSNGLLRIAKNGDSNGRSTTGVVSLILAALLFVAAAILGFLMVARMRSSADWVLHTYEVRSEIRSLRSLSSDLISELSTAAALDDATFLKNIPADLTEQSNVFSRLQSLTADNPAQQFRLRELSSLLDANRQQLLPCSGNLACVAAGDASRREFLHALYDRQNKMLAIVNSLEAAEQNLLQARLSAWSQRFRLMVVALVASVLSAIFLVIFNFRLLLKEIDRRGRSEQLNREHIDSYRALSGRILELQDTERRKIARDLHDSVGQYLAGVKFQLNQIERQSDGNGSAAKALFTETEELLDRCLSEIRTISHLLHPPLLDELGLYSAARWYVEGFSERSGLKVDLIVDDFVDRLHKDVEIALFRVLQEALTNVHRHSGAKSVKIDLSCKNNIAVLIVTDDGRGIQEETLRRYQEGHGGGIGLAGMRERLAELRGTLTVQSSSSGTTLCAKVPTDACKTSRPESASVGA